MVSSGLRNKTVNGWRRRLEETKNCEEKKLREGLWGKTHVIRRGCICYGAEAYKNSRVAGQKREKLKKQHKFCSELESKELHSTSILQAYLLAASVIAED